MRQLSTDHLTELLGTREPPCVSLYQPTHRHHPDNQQDPIRYRNLLRRMETSLGREYPARDLRPLLEKFHALGGDHQFWNHRTDGLAVLGSPDRFQVFELQRPVEELVVAADRFHTKPLLRTLQSADRYQVLCLSRREARLYEGNRYALDPVELSGVPASVAEVLGADLHEPIPDAIRDEPVTNPRRPAKKDDEVDLERERFFRAVDRGVLEHHSRPSGLPLLLAALPENQTPFRRVSHNPHLMEGGISQDHDALSPDQLREQAWRQVEPYYLARLTALLDAHHVARDRGLASDDPEEVARAASAGRVGTLLVEADREVPGRLTEAGGVEPGELAHPEVNDLLDELAQLVLRMKGEVVVAPAERMPSHTGVVATYRF